MSSSLEEKVEEGKGNLAAAFTEKRVKVPGNAREMARAKLNAKVQIVLDEIKNMALESNDMRMSLSFGECYGGLLINNPIGLYRDDSLEKRFAQKADRLVPRSNERLKNRILHVISTPYNHGGHTRLLERLVGFFPEKSDVLVTRPYQPEKASLRLPKDITVYSSQQGFDLPELVKILSSYKTICLHIHPDDLKTAVAVAVAKRRSAPWVIFVNHADHAFSFGFYSADVVAEVSYFGLVLTRANRSAESSFLGIPLDIEEYPQAARKRGDVCEIFTAARPLKYKPSNNYSFPKVALTILKGIRNARVTVVGARRRDYWWWPVKLRHPARFKVVSQLPHADFVTRLKNADVYLDSLPMAGGTALPEVRGMGVGVTGLVTGALGYTPFDKTKFATPEELVRELRQYASGAESRIEQLNNSSQLISDARRMHSPTEVKQRFAGMLAGEIQSCPVLNFHAVDVRFYETKWLEQGSVNVDWGLLLISSKQYMKGRRALLYKVVRAVRVAQLVRLLTTNARLQGKMVAGNLARGMWRLCRIGAP
jgi:hypothetical protein